MTGRLNIVPRFNCDFPLRDGIASLLLPSRSRTAVFSDPSGPFGEPAYWVRTGRLGLYVILRSLFPRGGKRVGVQAYTCRVVFEAIRLSGNRPVFLDVGEDYTLSASHLAKRVGEMDALIVTHTFGLPARLEELFAVAQTVPVIEDCAHAAFAEYRGVETGRSGVASFFSFGLAKPVSLGGGGVALVNDPDLRVPLSREVEALPRPSFAQEAKQLLKSAVVSLAHRRPLYGAITLPFLKRLNYAMDLNGDSDFTMTRATTLSEHMFSRGLGRFRKVVERRRQRASRLSAALRGRFACRWEEYEAEGRRSNAYLFPLRSPMALQVVSALRSSGFEAARHFHKAIACAADFGYSAGDCPVTERLVQETFTVPAHQAMSIAEVDELAAVLCRLADGKTIPGASMAESPARSPLPTHQ